MFSKLSTPLINYSINYLALDTKKTHRFFLCVLIFYIWFCICSNPSTTVKLSKCIYKTLFIKSCSKTLESPEKSGLPALHLFCSPFMAGAEGFEPSARGFGANVKSYRAFCGLAMLRSLKELYNNKINF